MRKERKNYTHEEKVSILRPHLIKRVPVSTLCEELQLRPTVSYRWLREFVENRAAAFQHRRDASLRRDQQRIAALEQKLQAKVFYTVATELQPHTADWRVVLST